MPPIDFRASQIQTNKIITSGSTGTEAKVLIYPLDVQNASNPNQGQINNSLFNTSSIGSDVYLYVSGAINSKNSSGSHGVSVFGGDVFISGNLYAANLSSSATIISGGIGDPSASYVLLNLTASLPNGVLGRNYFADISASFITIGLTSSLPNERKLTSGPGIIINDEGPGGNVYISASVTSSVPVSGTNLGSGSLIFSGAVGNSPQDFRFFTVIGQGSINVSNSGNFLIISSSANTGSGGSTYSASNTGSGVGVFSGSTGTNPVNFVFFSLSGSGGTTISASGDTIIISSSIGSTSTGSEASTTLNVISPTQITTRQDNYNPTNFNTASFVRISISGNQTITGFSASADFRQVTVILVVTNSRDTLTLAHQHASSTANNRIIVPGNFDYNMLLNDSANLFYDTVTARWRLF